MEFIITNAHAVGHAKRYTITWRIRITICRIIDFRHWAFKGLAYTPQITSQHNSTQYNIAIARTQITHNRLFDFFGGRFFLPVVPLYCGDIIYIHTHKQSDGIKIKYMWGRNITKYYTFNTIKLCVQLRGGLNEQKTKVSEK